MLGILLSQDENLEQLRVGYLPGCCAGLDMGLGLPIDSLGWLSFHAGFTRRSEGGLETPLLSSGLCLPIWGVTLAGSTDRDLLLYTSIHAVGSNS